jgi:hypothetical protein
MAILNDADYVENAQIWCYDIVEKITVKIADRIGLDPTTWHAELRIISQNFQP